MISCIASQRVVVVEFKKITSKDLPPKSDKYSMSIPRGFKVRTLVGGHSELERRYIYSDSAIIYISNFGNSELAYSNIRSLGDSISNMRLESIELKANIFHQLGKDYNPETLVLHNKASNGLYWKDVRIGFLSIGYVNVSENHKNDFDKALSSLKKNN